MKRTILHLAFDYPDSRECYSLQFKIFEKHIMILGNTREMSDSGSPILQARWLDEGIAGIKNVLVVFFLLSLMVCPAVFAKNDSVEKESIFMESKSAFESLERSMPGKDWIVKQNAVGLAWNESYRLMAFVAMFEGTGNTNYLLSALNRIDEVLKIRDDRRKIKDEIRGRILPAWSSTKYTKGKPYVWIVHAGMITYPIARCAYLIRCDPVLQKQYGAKADRYVLSLKETIQAFDYAWREDLHKQEGWYHGDYLNRDIPLNQQNALARTLVTLWLATGEEEYKSKAVKLGNYFKNRLRKEEDRYVWSYWSKGGAGEDISHAAINVDFAFTCFRAGIVFTRDDMFRFAKTLKVCHKNDRGFSRNVDGSGSLELSFQMGRWGHLGAIDPEIRRLLYRYFREHWTTNYTGGAIAAAYLVETSKPFQYDQPCFISQ